MNDAALQQSGLRWAGQRIDASAPGALPGLERVSGLVRSVRTPEFQGITFHEVLSKSALNHVPMTAKVLPGEWTINPYRGCTHACVYCYARPTHEHLGMGLGDDFDTQIVVKTNVAEVLRSELARKRELPERVAMGTNTDPYQRAEGRYALMPGIIDALADAGVDFSILTKGSLIRRDLDRLVRASERVDVQLGMSIAVLDDDLQSSIEPGTPSATARLATVRAIRDAGLDCTVFAAPLLPGLTDSAEQVDDLMGALADAGATNVLPSLLYLQPGVKELYLSWIERERPHLLDGYRRLYSGGTHASKGYQELVYDRARASLRRHGLPVPGPATRDLFGLHGRRRAPAPADPPAPTLF
ncbi:DNA repair photolyase [Frondihabitans sp. PhB188]|uniref:Rv2578c family radical SAM protein n=1 Tax=Frondihabitans sp. PhB188 TaxID=2485200 RepID=UPI000F4A838D|nr:Rv2578c family radical SAM protein [Frondihabitans sp. PhB188]ROQ39721.1 DNA repair photolyase [Frondihabitans sp. PhB188]